MQDEQPRVIPAGGYWLGVVPSGRILRLTDAHGNQAADTLFFTADDFSERYSAMQTIQARRAVYLTTGSILLSEQGRPMAEIIEDTCGRHDTLGGACAADAIRSPIRSPSARRHGCLIYTSDAADE